MLHGKVQIKNCNRNIKKSRKSKKERNCYGYRNNGLLDRRLILLTSEQYTLKIFYIVNKKRQINFSNGLICLLNIALFRPLIDIIGLIF